MSTWDVKQLKALSKSLQDESVILRSSDSIAVNSFRTRISSHLANVGQAFRELLWMHEEWKGREAELNSSRQDLANVTTQLAQVYEELDAAKKSNFTLQTENATLRNATALLPQPAPVLHPTTPFIIGPNPPTPISANRAVRTVQPSPSAPSSVTAASLVSNLSGRKARGGKQQDSQVKETLKVYVAATRVHIGAPEEGDVELVANHPDIEYLANGWPALGPGWLAGRFAYQVDDAKLIKKAIIDELEKEVTEGVRREGESDLLPPAAFSTFDPTSATGSDWDVSQLEKNGYWSVDPGLNGKTAVGKLFASKLGVQPGKDEIGPLTNKLRKLLLPLVTPGGWEKRDVQHDSFIVNVLLYLHPQLGYHSSGTSCKALSAYRRLFLDFTNSAKAAPWAKAIEAQVERKGGSLRTAGSSASPVSLPPIVASSTSQAPPPGPSSSLFTPRAPARPSPLAVSAPLELRDLLNDNAFDDAEGYEPPIDNVE